MNRLEAGQDCVIWWIWNAWIISCGWGWGGGHALHRGPLITPSLLHPHTRRGGTVWEKAAVLIWEVGRIIFLAHSGEWWWRLRHFIMMMLCLCWSSSWSSWWQTVEAGDEKDADQHVGRRSRQVWCVDGLACGASLPPAQTELLKNLQKSFFCSSRDLLWNLIYPFPRDTFQFNNSLLFVGFPVCYWFVLTNVPVTRVSDVMGGCCIWYIK